MEQQANPPCPQTRDEAAQKLKRAIEFPIPDLGRGRGEV